MKYSFLLSLWMIGFLFACTEEDKIRISEGEEKSYVLPQGDHDFDREIVEWRDRFGFYTLYIFEDKDVYWNNTKWEHGNDLSGVGIQYKMADPDYVEEQLNMFKRYFLNLYPELFLKQAMPLKVLLCSELWLPDREFVINEDGSYGYIPKFVRLNTHVTYDCVVINGGSSEILDLDVKTRNQFMREMALYFYPRLLEKNLLRIPESFLTESSYTYTEDVAGKKLFELGFLTGEVLKKGMTLAQSQSQDFSDYLAMIINHSLEELEGEMDWVGDYEPDPMLGGVFNPERDVNGLIKKKYEIVIAYLKEVGVDVSLYQNPDKE